MHHFYQDRLGTNIGKALKKSAVFPQRVDPTVLEATLKGEEEEEEEEEPIKLTHARAR
jgi:hypothetical protein